MGALSGGQRKRVALAHSLIIEPDLLMLDEPTNHLDAETVEWLERYLAEFKGALLLVTHDRYFLDRITNRMLEIDRGRVQTFAGNYGHYLEKKEEQEERQVVEAQRLKQMARRELECCRPFAPLTVLRWRQGDTDQRRTLSLTKSFSQGSPRSSAHGESDGGSAWESNPPNPTLSGHERF